MDWVYPALLYGTMFGFVIGLIWNVHKYGKILVCLFVVLGGILVITTPGGEASFTSGLEPWYIELTEFIGMIIGNILARGVLEEIKSES